MSAPTTHRTRVAVSDPTRTFPGFQFTCSCGAVSAVMSREGAELCRTRHLWENGVAA